MGKKIDLVIIDPQNSFCKVVDAAQQQSLHDGELCVAGAWDDMTRVANLVKRLGKRLDDIHVTLDSHHPLHIAHPIWYRDSKGNRPDPFTVMREENGSIIGSKLDSSGKPYDVGEYTCFKPSAQKSTLKYLRDLAAAKRYPHVIWPQHCLIGTPGHNVVPQLFDALQSWVDLNGDVVVDYVTKGSNPYTEHFSAVRAEVVDPNDNSTQLNTDFIKLLVEADEVVFAGEAGSHCLANTVRDIADSFADDSFIKKCVLLTDGTSPVPGFESYQTQFISDLTARGMKTSTTVDYLN